MTLNPQHPAPGLYPGLPAADYHAAAGLSASALTRFVRSPRAYRYGLDHPSEPTPDMQWGTALHAAQLEGRQTYTVRPAGLDGRTKEGKAWLASLPAGSHVMTEQEAADLLGAVAALRAHPHYGEVTWGVSELSCFAFDNELGTTIKCRFDSVTLPAVQGEPVLAVDIKTTRDASTRGFARDMFARRYHVQAALYRRVLRCLGYTGDFRWTFAVVQKGQPPLVNIRWLTKEAIDLGDETLVQDVEDWKRCRAHDHWPDFLDQDEHVGPIDVPEWAYGDKETLTGMTPA